MNMRYALAALFVLAGLSGLAQVPPASNAPPGTANSPTLTASANAPGPVLTNLTGYVPDDKYKLRVGDKISLQILEDRDLPKSLVVADSGELDVPYVGRVAAADKTCKQLADELKSAAGKGILLSGHGDYRAGRGEQVPGPGLCLGPGAQPGAD